MTKNAWAKVSFCVQWRSAMPPINGERSFRLALDFAQGRRTQVVKGQVPQDLHSTVRRRSPPPFSAAKVFCQLHGGAPAKTHAYRRGFSARKIRGVVVS